MPTDTEKKRTQEAREIKQKEPLPREVNHEYHTCHRRTQFQYDKSEEDSTSGERNTKVYNKPLVLRNLQVHALTTNVSPPTKLNFNLTSQKGCTYRAEFISDIIQGQVGFLMQNLESVQR